ncbi:hypothetical protein BHE74_00057181 [Ensete ventricosum]|nr:hypothetical protein BHE74_00057181 [Ensete ventricosum]
MKVYKELEKSLKTTCEEFIMATTKLVVDPMLSFVAKQGSPYRAVRPHTARYVPVRQLTDTWTDRYRAVLLKSTVDGRLRENRLLTVD